MAQQPLHPFFTHRPPPQSANVQVVVPPPRASLETSSAELRAATPDQDAPRSATSMDEDPNQDRRKRRRTVSPGLATASAGGARESADVKERLASVALNDPEEDMKRGGGAAGNGASESSAVRSDGAMDLDKETQPRTPPKGRTLRLRADGKLKSPGTAESTSTEESKGRRKRRSTGKRGKQTTIKYGKTPHDRLALGKRLDQIMSGKLRVFQLLGQHAQKGQDVPSARSQAGGEKSNENKTTHPFFLGKVERTSKTDPGSVKPGQGETKRLVLGERRQEDAESAQGAGRPSTFGSSFAKPVKFPGAVETLWPPLGMQHVRGRPIPSSDDVDSPDKEPGQLGYPIPRRKQKAKGRERLVPPDQVIYRAQHDLTRAVIATSANQSRARRLYEAKLNLPGRILLTGSDLKLQLHKRLCQRAPQHAAETAAYSEASQASMSGNLALPRQPETGHGSYQFLTKAAQQLFEQVPKSSSAFDTFDGDSQDWCHKYAPKRAEHVLQEQRDLVLLRDWIHAMNVDQVDSGSKTLQQGKLDARKQLAAKRRKRKIKEELDDFIVSSEEETGTAGEISELDEARLPLPLEPQDSSFRGLKKLKASSFGKTHAVLLSGPTGCGKTASVYAIAAELGFEVFEINAGVRRNGRDIMDRVGDMTRNHLVGHDGKSKSDDNEESTAMAVDDVVDEKQQSVTSFFKMPPSDGARKPSFVQKKAAPKAKNQDGEARPRRQQKQSLILLEEVDMLFEEDKPFWTAVFALIVQSRRPVIMTCTNEHALPLSEFVDTATLRLAPPKAAVVSEYLLCIAAHEGHLLDRAAVDNLVLLRRNDLRGAINELQFWCQMAVGDNRHGIAWFMEANSANKRRGTDQEPVRVISDGTYQANCFLLDRKQGRVRDLEYDIRVLSEAYLLHAHDLVDAGVNHEPPTKKVLSREERLEYLRLNEASYDALSAADTWAHSPSDLDQLDATKPSMTDKARASFVDDYKLLQADLLEDHSGVACEMAFAVRAMARFQLNGSTHVRRKQLASALLKRQEEPGMVRVRSATRVQATRAFQPLTEPDDGTPWNPSKGPGLSVLHAPMSIVAAEIAPAIRSVALYDLELAEQRTRLNDLLAEPGREKKRQRRTRASRAALEGGSKASTRREKWWEKDVDYRGMLKTATPDWTQLASAHMKAAMRQESVGSEIADAPSSQSMVGTPAGETDESADELSREV